MRLFDHRDMTWVGNLMALSLLGGCGDHAAPALTGEHELSVQALRLYPQGRVFVPGESLRFLAVVQGADGMATPATIRWSATGGLIDQSGFFLAGEGPATYQVLAEVVDSDPPVRGTAEGQIRSSSSFPDSSSAGEGLGVVFSEGFESGDFRLWGDKVPIGDPHASGYFDGGAHIGLGYITDEIARTGGSAWRAQVDPAVPPDESDWPIGKSSLERWRILDGVREFTVSAWYYLPLDYPVGLWTNLMQLKERSRPWKPTAVIALNIDQRLLLYDALRGVNVEVTGVVIPRGRWVNITTHFVIDRTQGQVTTWLDGNKIIDESGLNTLGHSGSSVYFGVGNYVAGKLATRCHLYIDDVEVTVPQ